MSSNDLNIFQQIYLQAFTANLTGTVVGTEAFIQAALNKAVKILMTTFLKPCGWEVTWGPRVWKEKPSEILSGLDNAWFAAFAPNVKYPDGTTIDTCVVAIAGTAVFSKHDWPVENFGVDKIVNFNDWIQKWTATSIPRPDGVQKPPLGEQYTAFGTSDGVYELMVNTSPSGNPGEGTNIIQYLQTLPGKCRVIFTGHSLGGALSPTVPMGLEGAGLLSQIQDPTENIRTLPAAGASPGENQFSQAYSKLFPKSGTEGYQIWNTDFYNKLDIVPQAWCTDPKESEARNLQNILTIYGKLPDGLAKTVGDLIKKESDVANSSGVIYDPIQGTEFSGTPPKTPPSNIASFIIEAVFQHTKAYYDQVKVTPAVANIYRQFTNSEGVEKRNVEQAAQRFPALRWLRASDLPEMHTF